MNNPINFFLEEKIDETQFINNEETIVKMLNEFREDIEDINGDTTNITNITNITNRGLVFTKDLLKICQYYGIDKDIKASKCKKQDILSTIMFFESLPENVDIVNKRYKMWAYILELTNDPKMKKYIIWT